MTVLDWLTKRADPATGIAEFDLMEPFHETGQPMFVITDSIKLLARLRKIRILRPRDGKHRIQTGASALQRRRAQLMDALRARADHNGVATFSAHDLAAQLGWKRPTLLHNLKQLGLPRLDNGRGGRGQLHSYKLTVTRETVNPS